MVTTEPELRVADACQWAISHGPLAATGCPEAASTERALEDVARVADGLLPGFGDAPPQETTSPGRGVCRRVSAMVMAIGQAKHGEVQVIHNRGG